MMGSNWEVMHALHSVLVSLYILFPALLIFLGVNQEIVLWEAASLFSVLRDIKESNKDGISAPNAITFWREVARVQASCSRKCVCTKEVLDP